jgi:AraC-like DNA-binding protein
VPGSGLSLPIGVLAATCGFRTAAHFCGLFKAGSGMPPGDVGRGRWAAH